LVIADSLHLPAAVATPVSLEFKDNCQQAISAIHIFDEMIGFVATAARGTPG